MRISLWLVGLLMSYMASASEELLWQPEAAIVPAEITEAEQRYQQHQRIDDGVALIAQYINWVRRSDSHEYLQRAVQLQSTLAAQAKVQNTIDWLLVSADLFQYQHKFQQAHGYLKRLLEVEPTHLQASLMQARIALAQGNNKQAKGYCSALFGHHSLSIVSTCLLEVEGRSGRLQAAYEQLTNVQRRQQESNEPNAISRWRLQILIEQALLLERYTEARNWINQLPQGKTIVEQKLLLDSYLLDDIANFPNERVADCQSELTDALAVRVALAQQRLNGEGCWVDYIKERMYLRVLRNDRLHSADIAFYYTYLVKQPAEAVKWANLNYSIAKEPFDKKLLVDARQLQKEAKN